MAVFIYAGTSLLGAEPAERSPRERISIDDGWRFTKGDPNGDSAGLIYDVRPVVKDKKDDRAADTEPTEAEKIAATLTLKVPATSSPRTTATR